MTPSRIVKSADAKQGEPVAVPAPTEADLLAYGVLLERNKLARIATIARKLCKSLKGQNWRDVNEIIDIAEGRK